MNKRTIMHRILERDNLNAAFKKVKRNKGAAGVDEMTTDELGAYMNENKTEILQQIRDRKYHPAPVLRVEIPKPNGGVRLLRYRQSRTA